ncbi:MAG: exo-alpha-sialidase [Verrucomicrobiales bacterium]|nr:exo-alpha-sialidase [Verrucomicrobiales bacterium]
MKPLLICLFLLTNFVTAEITITRVFGPDTKTGPYKHPSCLTELDNGDLYLAYYGGGGEYAESTRVFASRLVKGSSKWTAPQVIAGNPFKSLGNPVVWQAPDGVVWLFYVTRFGETWSTSRIKAKISRDGAKTWSDSFLVTLQDGTMVRNQPIVLSDGDYLLPIYHETGADTEFTGADSTSRMLRFTPGQTQWREVGVIRSDKGNIQPGVVETSPGNLIAYCRRCGDYEPTDQGWTVTASSTDGGKTWTKGTDSTFKNPNSALDFKKLANGHLLLVFNDHMYERSPLTVAISEDQGRTFLRRQNIMEGEGSYAYPTAIQTKDGKIHVIFTSDERSVIQHAVFDEADVLRP